EVSFAAPEALRSLADGVFYFGLRSMHLSMVRRSAMDISLRGQVELAEVSGSETFIHIRNAQIDWIVQQEGVHQYALGQQVEFYFNPAQLYAFRADGSLQHSPLRLAA
ncbi:MAG: TOBE domain-containing protein, partial [Pseudohongiellaceae bacterium]